MPRLPFMKPAAESTGEDKFTRDDAPRTRPRPSTTTNTTTKKESEKKPTATPNNTHNTTTTSTSERQRRRLSMTPTIEFLKHPSEWRSRLPAIFNIVRFVIYGVVLVFTAVCIAVAVHFNGVLQPSELTTFVPLAIFVSVASILIFPILLILSLWKREANPISTRIELGCLGLAGTLWIALGAFLASSDAEVAEVECYATEYDTEPVSLPGFTTDTFHAQYHVLEAFALFNAVLIWGFLLFATFLAFRHHRRGVAYIWYQPVTALPWSGQGVKDTLPDPAVARTRGARTPAVEKSSKGDYFAERGGRSAANTPGGPTPYWTPGATPGQTPRAAQEGYVMWMPHMAKDSKPAPVVKPPPPAFKNRQTNRYDAALERSGTGSSSQAPLVDKFRRDASPRRQDSQRSQQSQAQGDRWARGASPVRKESSRSRNEPQRTASASRTRDPQRQDSARAREGSRTREPQRQDSARNRDPQRQDSSRTRDPQRQGSRSDKPEPKRQDSSSRPNRYEPARKDSSRSQTRELDPQRKDSTRSGRDPQRMDSKRSDRPDRWGRDASPRR